MPDMSTIKHEMALIGDVLEAAADYRTAHQFPEFANEHGGLPYLRKKLFDAVDEYQWDISNIKDDELDGE